MVKHVNENEFNEIIKGDLPVVCDFWATWCGPCRMLAPVFEKVSEEYEGKAVFVKVDVDDNENLARKCGITSIPNVILFKNGEAKANSLGFVPAEKLKQFINNNL